MIVYKVEVSAAARRDLAELLEYLSTIMSREGAHRYADIMTLEVQSLSEYASLYNPSPLDSVRRYHPKARRMVSHNRRWVYIFHIEDDVVIVDRIRPVKMLP